METKKVAKEYLQKDILRTIYQMGNGKRMISRSKESSY